MESNGGCGADIHLLHRFAGGIGQSETYKIVQLRRLSGLYFTPAQQYGSGVHTFEIKSNRLLVESISNSDGASEGLAGPPLESGQSLFCCKEIFNCPKSGTFLKLGRCESLKRLFDKPLPNSALL